MTTKRKQKGEVRKLTPMGDYSVYIVLPRSAIKELGWRKGQKVVARRSGRKIVIEDWKPK
jgi:antitoxin component of MazEF toxin-antitoxin module